MASWRPVPDIQAPIRIGHLHADNLAAELSKELAPPYFVLLWRGERPIAQFSAFCGLDAPLGRQAVQRLDQNHGVESGNVLASPPSSNPQADRQSLSLVICTRDRPGELDRCLKSLPAQTRPPDEVIVVDNASRTDDTRRVAERHGAAYVREERPGLDIARNAGAAASQGDIIAYTDDDTILHPAWLSRIADAFDDPKIWAVTGLVLPAELETPAQCIFEKVWGFGRGFQRRDFGPQFYAETRRRACPAWEIGGGANMAFRRNVFADIGGFDERLDVGAAGCSGDSEYWNRLLHAGGTCRYEPSAVVYHYHRRGVEGLSAQIRAYMRGHVVALLVQFERTGERGNLRRLSRSLPGWYLRQGLRCLAGRRNASICLWFEEVCGCLEGNRRAGASASTSTARSI
jgi:glycosyltransferase involved in cell wall biosynthesis